MNRTIFAPITRICPWLGHYTQSETMCSWGHQSICDGLDAGTKPFGPMAESKLSVEMQRLSSLTRSTLARGFKPRAADDDLGGRFLVANGQWRWLPTVGMHRIPVAPALCVRELVRVISVIRREEVSIWPKVQSGLFSERAALAVFDLLLAGRPPACASDQIKWVDGQDWHGA